jgi:glycerol-3-phosphate acyltransferase PlsX
MGVRFLKILLDAMGGDHAPESTVLGCIDALNQKSGFEVVLIGKEELIIKYLKGQDYPQERLHIVNASQVIENDDVPTKAYKEKKDSSMVKGVEMLKEGEGDVFLSAGNTGALMTTSLFTLGRIKGVDRPALSFYFPGKKGPVLIIDVGANTVCKPENYMQFGVMGSIYMREVLGIENPRVGLINVGTENQKGNEVIKVAYSLLEKSNINFTGNIEGRDIPESVVDVVVCDGFVGNVILKFSEGVAGFFVDSLKNIYKSNFLTKLSFLVIKKKFKKFFNQIDYKEHGGVPLLGIAGKVMKAHGSSDRKAIKSAVLKGTEFARSKAEEVIEEEFKNNSEIFEKKGG